MDQPAGVELYRLPELVHADPAALVLLVEGEKDVDRLRSLGLTATCNPGGAGKWRSSYSKALAGRRVIIIGDNDAPGRDHAKKVAKALSSVAAHIAVLNLPELPPKGDVSNWLDSGGTAEELLLLAEQAPAYSEPVAPSPAGAQGDVLLTEHGVAVAFRERHADRLRYCHDTGAWFVWDGCRWRQDRTHAAFSFARDLIAEANRDEETKIRAITGKAAFAGGVERFARADQALAVTAESWDRDARDGVEHNALAVPASAMAEDERVFLDIAGEAVAAPALHESDEVAVALEGVIEEAQPQGRRLRAAGPDSSHASAGRADQRDPTRAALRGLTMTRWTRRQGLFGRLAAALSFHTPATRALAAAMAREAAGRPQPHRPVVHPMAYAPEPGARAWDGDRCRAWRGRHHSTSEADLSERFGSEIEEKHMTSKPAPNAPRPGAATALQQVKLAHRGMREAWLARATALPEEEGEAEGMVRDASRRLTVALMGLRAATARRAGR